MAVLTVHYYINQTKDFIANIRETQRAYYVFAGRSQPWPDDSNPPPANTSVDQYQQTVYDDLLFGKRIESSDVEFMIPRYNWTANSVYAQFDPTDPDLYSKQFYAVNDQLQVFKCIFNNNGSNSTIKPSLVTTRGNLNSADGYIWKYMYTIDSSSNLKFSSDSFVPALQDPNVQSNSIPGTIDAMQITNGGSGYSINEEGFIVGFINPTTIQLPATGSSDDNYYTNSSIYLKAGYGAGQIREIVSSNGSAKTISVSANNPFVTSQKLELTNILGTILSGYQVQQPIDYINFVYQTGYINPSATVIQSDTAVSGIVLATNSSIIQISRSNLNTPFSNNNPIVDTSSSGTLKNGVVTITSGSNVAVSTNTAQTSFTTDYTVGSYIRVGSNVNNNIRRITAVNTSTINVSLAFANSLTANAHYLVTSALEPVSIIASQANGNVSNVNLTSVKLTLSTGSVPGLFFYQGEKVDLVSSSNNNQGSNGIISYANSSVAVLTAVNDPSSNFTNTYFWSNNFYIYGESSAAKYLLVNSQTKPNITINNYNGAFVVGQKINFTFNGSPVANALLTNFTTIPDNTTEYQIGPTVKILGDGAYATALGIVNTADGSTKSINSILMVNTGIGYTKADIYIYANSNFGNGATAYPLISPLNGHGYDTITELGARYAGLDAKFDINANESYYFPTYGSYRRIGVIQTPQLADVRVSLTSFDRVNLTLNASSYSVGPSSSWIPNEVVVQTTSNAAGVVVYGNSSFLQLKTVKGTFANNYGVSGYYSQTYANVVVGNTIYFTRSGGAEIVSEVTSGANAVVQSVYSNTLLQLSNVVGHFTTGDTLYDSSTNAYATIGTITTANGSQDQTTTLGMRFNQTARITLTSNNGAFSNNEYVQQDVTNANGRIVSTSDELDLSLTSVSGSFSIGQTVTDQTTYANGIVVFANTSYLKLTSVSQTLSFGATHTINNGSTSTATISHVYPVLVLNDINGANRFQASTNNIIGQTSGASGKVNSYSLITYPDLIRESGDVIYLENVSPITRKPNSQEEFKLVIRF